MKAGGMALNNWTGMYDCFDAANVTWSTFKILLKTKDDPWFIRRWYEHHCKIVAPQDIIIFDNDSSNPDVTQFYRDIAEATHIFRFPGNMDTLHNTAVSQSLYEQLEQCCEFFCFLDTDEYLYAMAGQSLLLAPEHVASAAARAMETKGDFLPTLWLNNVFKNEDQFLIYNQDHFSDCLRWSKPIIRASSRISGVINHNIQVVQSGGRTIDEGGFLVVHLREFLPEQRISANMNKLRAFGLINETDDVDDVLAADFSGAKIGNPVAWVGEIRHFLDSVGKEKAAGNIVISNRQIFVRDRPVADMLGSFYDDPAASLRMAFT